MVRLPRVICVGAVVTHYPQVILVVLALPDLQGYGMADHPVSSLVSIAHKTNLTNDLQSHGLRFVLIARVLGDRTGNVCVHAYSTIIVDVDNSRSENPFNYDLNDLDLDGFCLMLQRDLHEITAVSPFTGSRPSFSHRGPASQHPGQLTPDDYVFTTWNQPFAPADRRSAEEIMSDTRHTYHGDSWKESVRQTLLQNWKMVDTETRKR